MSYVRSQPRTALVLGAGGVRGCAHAGVIEVLREAGVQIDLVVGASVGSMFGLGFAADLPTEDIVEPARNATRLDLFRFYAGRLRPSRFNPIGAMLLEAGEGRDFADLPLPLAVLATDVESGRPTVFNSGPVLPAVQASIAIPLIARPVLLGDRFYLDGGLLDTAPVGVARQLGAERVIAVCLGYNYTAPQFLRKRPWTRGWVERMGRQPCAVRGRLPDVLRFGCRLYAASYNPPIPAEDADIAIWPDLGSLSPNALSGAAFCYQQGVKAARAALPQIERLAEEAS